jgi:hypothetical protein
VNHRPKEPAPIDRRAFAGYQLVINFFASWYTPFRAETRAFEQAFQLVQNQVGFLGLAVADRPTDVKALAQETRVTYPIGLDSGNLSASLGTVVMPATVFVDSGGIVVEIRSAQITREQLVDRLEQLFAVKATP